jgi:hypothetical protein
MPQTIRICILVTSSCRCIMLITLTVDGPCGLPVFYSRVTGAHNIHLAADATQWNARSPANDPLPAQTACPLATEFRQTAHWFRSDRLHMVCLAACQQAWHSSRQQHNTWRCTASLANWLSRDTALAVPSRNLTVGTCILQTKLFKNHHSGPNRGPMHCDHMMIQLRSSNIWVKCV